MAAMAAADPNTHHRLMTGFPPQERQLVLDTEAVVWLGRAMADWVAEVADR